MPGYILVSMIRPSRATTARGVRFEEPAASMGDAIKRATVLYSRGYADPIEILDSSRTQVMDRAAVLAAINKGQA